MPTPTDIAALTHLDRAGLAARFGVAVYAPAFARAYWASVEAELVLWHARPSSPDRVRAVRGVNW